MLLLLLLISTIASVIASAVLGVRLLWLARRSRQLPEAMIGSSFILSGVIGYVIMLAGNPTGGALSAEAAERLFSIGYGLIGIGVCCVYVFIWRTFRPDAAWARWLALAGIVLVLATSEGAIGSEAGLGPVYWLGLVGRMGAGVWGASESLRWWSLMRRRLALGLADSVVCNRFLLWGMANIATASIFLGSTLMMSTEVTAAATTAPMSAAGMMLVSSLTIITATLQWLAFFPPKRYLRWVDSRDVAPAS